MNPRLVVAVAYFKRNQLYGVELIYYTHLVSSFTSDNTVYSHETVASVER